VGAIAQLSGGIAGVLNTCYYTLQNATSAYCQAIQRDPGTGQITNVNVGLANTGALKTEGVDFEARYRYHIGRGILSNASTLDISSNWTWVTEYNLTPIKEMPNVRNECAGSYGATCGEPIPNLKGITRVTWSDGPLDLSLRYRFIDSVTVDTYLLPLRAGGTVPPLDTLTNPILPRANYFDWSFVWHITDNAQVSGGVNNLTNWGPPIVGSSSGYGNTWPATYDPYGRTFFLNGRVKF
jgi:outer membrane receptor protein involved in Fe transport